MIADSSLYLENWTSLLRAR